MDRNGQALDDTGLDDWLRQQFSGAADVPDDGFSLRVIDALERAARRDRLRAWILFPVVVVGALFCAEQIAPLLTAFTAPLQQGAYLPEIPGLADIADGLRATSADAGVLAGVLLAATVVWVVAEAG